MKYPRTYHLPWLPGTTNDDKTVKTMEYLYGKNIAIKEKLDGENTSLFESIGVEPVPVLCFGPLGDDSAKQYLMEPEFISAAGEEFEGGL